METTNFDKKQIPKKIFSYTGVEISRVGFGCMNLSYGYGPALSHEEGIEMIGKALEQGQNFYDTAYMYNDNEMMLAKAIKKYGREKFFICTKIPAGVITWKDGQSSFELLPGSRETILKYCDESLKRLEIDYIDMLYSHRVDANIPIEEQAGAYKELIQQGKIRHYGLSEVSEDTIRRAHAVHPLAAVQEEYSLQTRDIETNGVLKTCRELNIALVAYSPLGRGMLTGTVKKSEDLSKEDHRNAYPRFQGENFEKNIKPVERLQQIAENLKVTPSQLAISWLLAKGDDIFPIPGTRQEKYLVSNQNAASIQLSEEVVKELDELFPVNSVVGTRYKEELMPFCAVSTVKKD